MIHGPMAAIGYEHMSDSGWFQRATIEYAYGAWGTSAADRQSARHLLRAQLRLEDLVTGCPHLRWLSAALLVAACAPDPPCGLRLCDIRDADCQRVTAEGAACLRGVEPVTVPVVIVPRDAFVAEAAATTLTPAEEEAFRRWNAGLAALGLAPIDNSPGTDGDARATWLGGFYSSQDKQITVIDDGRPLDGWPFIALLVHEYVHAIQDARFDLAQLHATHDTDLDQVARARRRDRGRRDVHRRSRVGGILRGRRRRDPLGGGVRPMARRRALRGAPVAASGHVVALAFSLPVRDRVHEGGARRRRGGRTSTVCSRRRPSGTREVMAGFGAAEPTGVAWAEDLGADAVPILDERFAYVGADRMGAWLLEVFLDRPRAVRLRRRTTCRPRCAATPCPSSTTGHRAVRSRSGASGSRRSRRPTS